MPMILEKLNQFVKTKLLRPKNRAKTPLFLQMQAIECGAASLGIILGYFGKFLSLEELRQACKISRDGGNAFDILHAARAFGLIGKGLYADPEEMKRLRFPMIALWGGDHFLVVEGYHKDKFYLNDPAFGHRVVNVREFNQQYKGIVLTFDKDQHFTPSKTQSNLFLLAKNRFRNSIDSLLLIAGINLALVLTNILIPFLTKNFVDYIYFLKYSPELFSHIVIGMFLVILFTATLTWIQQRQLLKLQTKLKITSSCRFLWRLLSLPVKFFQHRYLFDLVQRTQSTAQISEFLLKNILLNGFNLIIRFIYLGVMFYFSISLTLISIFFIGISLTSLYLLTRKKQEDNLHILQEEGKLSWTIVKALRMIVNLKSMNGEEELFMRWSGYKVKIINLMQRLGSYTEILKVLAWINFLLMSFCVLAVGSWQIMSGQLTLGTLIAFQILLFNFNAPIYNWVALTTEIQAVIAKIFRVEDVLHYSSNSQQPFTPEKNGELPAKLKGNIELQNINFGYTLNNSLLFENFNLSIQSGQWLGIVGASGSGKTTLIKLMIGSEDPWSGRILWDGCAYSQISQRILANSLAVVYHQPILFQESVIDNITLRDHSISLERVIQAAKLSCIHDHINTRTEKYHTILDQQGSNFSIGEQQQIDIARALINNPAVLILDEATACLDPLTERKIWENIRPLYPTGIIVTNQSSLLKNCNEIIILEKGKIIERGHYADMAGLAVYKAIAVED